MKETKISAKSLDGVWTFDGSHIVSAHARIEPFEIDFFERWTFARFLPKNALALGFESSQPWSENGSYGDRYGGVEIMALTEAPATWSLVSFEFDSRYYDETFVPDDVTWHQRGVLAWLINGALEIQILQEPRGIVPWELVPERDSSQPLLYRYEIMGDWKRLDLSMNGDELIATDQDGPEFFDLMQKRRSRDGSTWEPWDECGFIR